MSAICALSLLAINPPDNLPNPNNKAAILNPDNSLSINGNGLSQVGIRSLSDNNYVFLTSPDNITVTYRITFQGSPTNGFFLGTVNNGTNVVLTSVGAGVTQNIDVLVAGNTTNRLFISSGIITNIISL